MISDSVELWDTDDCLLHIKLMGTNVRLSKKQKVLSQGHQQHLSLELDPIDNAEPCFPHGNIVGSH